MNQRKTNALLFIAVIALAIMILLLIISQAGRGNALAANSGGKGISRGLADHLKGTSSSTNNAETPSTNAPPVTPPITNEPTVTTPLTNQAQQPLLVKPIDDAIFFGTRSKGNRLVFIIDKSGSMSGSRLEKAKKELIRTLKSLPSTKYFFVYFYDDVGKPMPRAKLQVASPNNVNSIIRWIGTVNSGGGTDPTGALRGAFQMKASTIWLLTDGQFSSDVAALCRELNPKPNNLASRVTPVLINTVAFGGDSGTLQKIAKENDGTYVRD